MRAIGYEKAGAIDAAHALIDLLVDEPTPGPRDLLVEVRAVSVNPVDTKLRRGAQPEAGARILGFDAAGVVRAVGREVTLFRPGDEVFYAGDITRPGSNAELQLVDERIVGPKPRTLGFAEAAALPLTAITAWEMLFDRLDVRRPVPGAAPAALVIGGAGGVGAIAIQLLKALTDLIVVATASRPETADFVRSLGADHVLDHSRPLAAEWQDTGLGAPGFVFSTTQSDKHFADVVALMAPQGRYGLIDDPAVPPAVMSLKRKALSLHWEMMFARPMFQTPDMIEQHRLLSEVSRLIDAGRIRTTLTETRGPITAATLIEAHRAIETGRTRGKIVIEGWPKA
ncbi:MAG: zinc-binding alcohol dehydrogenase family protein [Paracoccaceae bacterium]